MSKKNSLSRRCYWHSLIVYSAPNTFMPLLNRACHWAYAYHDLDVDDNGCLKPPHYHIVVHFKQACSINSCKKYIFTTQNVFGEECHSPQGAYEYLWHKNDLDKYQYDKSIVVVHSQLYWDRFLPDIRDRTNIDFIEDLMSGADMLTMAKRYGRDYMKNYRLYNEFADEVRYQQRQTHVPIKAVYTPQVYQGYIGKQMEFTDKDFD